MIFNNKTRRHFLQGAGGFALSIPFLPSLVRAQSATVPKRCIFIVSLEGQRYSQMAPNITDAQMTRTVLDGTELHYKKMSEIVAMNGRFSNVLREDFNGMADKMSVLFGLDIPSYLGHSSYAALSGSGPLVYKMGTTEPKFSHTIDKVMGQSDLYYQDPVAQPLWLVSPEKITTFPKKAAYISQSWDMISGQRVRLPYETDPRIVFNSLFAGLTVNPPSQAQARKTAQQSVIDMIKSDLDRTLNGTKVSQLDKLRLQQFVDTVNDTQKSIMAAQNVAAGCVVPSSPLKPTNHAMSYTDHINLAISGLVCQLTGIVVISVRHGGSSNHGFSNNHVAGTVEDELNADENQFIAKDVFLKTVQQLDGITDINGKTMLDNSFVAWLNELGNGANHRTNAMPIITAGSADGRFQQGYFYDYAPRPMQFYDKYPVGIPYSKFLISVMSAFGLNRSSDFEQEGLKGFWDHNPDSHRENKGHFKDYYTTDFHRKTLPMFYGSSAPPLILDT